MSKLINNVHCCDCVEGIKMLPDSSIDLGVTSPPFDNLRQYGGKNPFSWEIFQAVADQLHRVLKQGGIVDWDVQDEMKDGNISSTSFRQVLYFQKIGFKRHETIIMSNGGRLPCRIIIRMFFDFVSF